MSKEVTFRISEGMLFQDSIAEHLKERLKDSVRHKNRDSAFF